MTELPLVSILVPSYNHGNFVEQCLNSILDDRYPHKEVVIIDDGSSDHSTEVIANWKALHAGEINVRFHRRENRGVSRTLNELTELAKGELLRVVASDDYVLPNGLTDQVAYLQRFPSLVAVFGDAIVVDNQGQKTCDSLLRDVYGADKSKYLNEATLRSEIISRWSVGGPVLMARKAAIMKIGGWNEGLVVEDWDLYLRLLSLSGLGFIDSAVGAYRLHGSNTSRTKDTLRRIRNLGDMREVARRCSMLFDEPFRSCLRAQESLSGAKIAFLQRRYFDLTTELCKLIAWKANAYLRRT